MSFILLGILNSQTVSGGGSSYDLLETTTLGSDTLQVSFTNLNNYSAYKHLQFRLTVRDTDGAETPGSAQIYLNGGGSTRHHFLRANGSSVTSGNNTTYLQDFQVRNNLPSDIYTGAIINILDFSNTSKNKTVQSFDGYAASANSRIHLRSFFRDNTAAITSVIFEAQVNWKTGSRFSLYGIK